MGSTVQRGPHARRGKARGRSGPVPTQVGTPGRGRGAPGVAVLTAAVRRGYIFCYHHGREFLKPEMHSPDREGFVRRLLTEQVCPSDLGVHSGGASARAESG